MISTKILGELSVDSKVTSLKEMNVSSNFQDVKTQISKLKSFDYTYGGRLTRGTRSYRRKVLGSLPGSLRERRRCGGRINGH